jgi:hypothetical protein
MLSNNTPIVQTSIPMIRLRNTLAMPERNIIGEGTNEQGGVLHGCVVLPTFASFQASKCSGDMCDLAEFAERNGRAGAQTCACFRGTNNGAQTVPNLTVSVDAPGRDRIMVNGFMSKHFCDTFLFQPERPARVIPRHFHSNQIAVLHAFKKCFRHINDRGGWTVVLWAKQAMVDDLGGQQDQANNQNQRGQQVEAGQTNYHIVSMEPTDPSSIDRVRFERRRLDLNALAANST